MQTMNTELFDRRIRSGDCRSHSALLLTVLFKTSYLKGALINFLSNPVGHEFFREKSWMKHTFYSKLHCLLVNYVLSSNLLFQTNHPIRDVPVIFLLILQFLFHCKHWEDRSPRFDFRLPHLPPGNYDRWSSL